MAIQSSSGGSKPPAPKRLVAPEATAAESDGGRDEGLRPRRLCDYIGQSELKQVLGIAVEATRLRNDALDHVLLYGPPGLGKTTMALVLAEELGVSCRIASAPALERPRDIVGLLMNLQPRELLFIDEIHRLNRVAEELLYPAMEDFRLDLTVGAGPAARTRSLELPPFTLVGATTKAGSLSSPLRDRFGLIQRLEFYSCSDLEAIVSRSAQLLQLELAAEAAAEIAQRCRGTPRIANRLLRRVRDFASVRGIAVWKHQWWWKRWRCIGWMAAASIPPIAVCSACWRPATAEAQRVSIPWLQRSVKTPTRWKLWWSRFCCNLVFCSAPHAGVC